MKKVFMDHASTTKVDDEVLDAMLPYFSKYFGNPSSIHLFGRETHDAVDLSRRKVADLLNAKEDEIIFTQEELRQIISQSKALHINIKRKEAQKDRTSSPLKLNILPYYRHVNIWRRKDLK